MSTLGKNHCPRYAKLGVHATQKYAVIQLLVINTASAAISSSAQLEGNVYVMDNNPAGNRVIVYGRYSNGQLLRFGSSRTGGLGAGDNAEADPLGSQESMILGSDKRTLYVVNAGSDDISVFYLLRNGQPILIQVVSSQGDFPVSLTTDGDFLYALNSGTDGTIAGYSIESFGRLSPLDGSVRTLSTGQDGPPIGDLRNINPGDIAFDTLNRRLVIAFGAGTEAGEGRLLTFAVDDQGIPGEALTETTAPGRLPFSVDFTANGTLLVAEALGTGDGNSSSVSTLNFSSATDLEVVNSAELNTAALTCWVRAANTSDLVFTTNSGSGSISVLRASRNGVISVVDEAAATDLGIPIDFDLTDDDRYMYVTTSTDGGVAGFSVNPDTGELRSIGLFSGLPTLASDGFAPQGLVVR